MNHPYIIHTAVIATLTALLLPGTLQAESLTITNPGFETNIVADGAFNVAAPPTGWSNFGSINQSNRSTGTLNPTGTQLYTGGAREGDNVAVVFLQDGTLGLEGGIQQILSATLQPLTQYTLSLQVGNIGNDPNPPHNSFNFTGFPGYRIDLLAGGVVLASDNNSLAGTIPDREFRLSSLQFTTGASHPELDEFLAIRLVNLDGLNGIEVNFDDVELLAIPVPEPSSALLLACGSAALLRRRRG